MGIFGAGLATAIGQCLSALIMLTHFGRKKNTLRFVKIEHILQKIGKITVTGFSTGINDLAMGIIGICFNRQIMFHLGSDALAVYGVITQVTIFATCLSYCIGQGAQPIISQNYGAGQYGRIKECLKYALYTCAGFGVFWTMSMMLAPNLIVNLFMNSTPSVMEIAPRILRIYGISYLLLPFNVFATYYFQAIMKSHISVIASLARGLVISGATIMLLPLIFDPNSIWFAMLVTEITVGLFGLYYMVRETKVFQ